MERDATEGPVKRNMAEDEWTLAEIILDKYPDVPRRAILELERAATRWKVRKGHAIVEQDTMCDRWFFVAQGLVRIMYTKGKKTDTLFFDGGGAIFASFHGIVANEPGVFRMEALLESWGWEIEHSKYEEVARAYPELRLFELNFLRNQIYCLEEYYRWRAMSTPQQLYDRFCSQWSSLLRAHDPNVLSKYIPLKVIAQYLSMTPQMLSILRRRELERNRRKN